MGVKPNEIYLTKLIFNQNTDIRPSVIINIVNKATVKVAAISSAIDLYSVSMHFLLKKDDPDFPATNLKRTSYISGEMLYDIPLSQLGKRIGELKGNLALNFNSWL